MFKEFLAQYGFSLIYALITAIAGYVGIVIKNLYKRYADDKTKRDVVKNCVLAVDQLYKNLHGEEKFNMCFTSVVEILNEKGISISELEARCLIESAVREVNLDYMLIDDEEDGTDGMTEEEYETQH